MRQSDLGAALVNVPEGIRFSHNYIARREPTADSSRMRRRIYRVFTTLGSRADLVSGEAIELGLGVEVPWSSYGRNWEQFFLKCEIHDFLDLITVVAANLRQKYSQLSQSWIKGVAVVFAEENVHYRLDPRGGFHFAIDGEFAHNQTCTIAALQPMRYGAARSHFEAGQQALDANPQQTREAIRQTFECVETIFKLMFPVAQLGNTEVNKRLKPLLDRRLHGTERDTAMRLAEGFNDWITGAHPYRHGQAVEEPDNPSLATAVLSVSLGASYARWLAELDARTNGEF